MGGTFQEMQDYANANYGPDDEYWVDCWNCGGAGEFEGDCTCGDDCCCCAEPDPPQCSECKGAGGWWVSNGKAAEENAVVNVGDELHQILGEALAKTKEAK